MLNQKRTNKNNRKRGASFEKWVGDFLDMDVVPYSGSNARFGYGDVRDTIWLGECKNITPDENGFVTIKYDWLIKNIERANNINHLSYLAWMPAGTIYKYIILDIDTFIKLHSVYHIDIIFEKKSHNTKNFIMNTNNNNIKDIKKSNLIARIMLDGSNEHWYMMSIEMFKILINDHKLKGNRVII